MSAIVISSADAERIARSFRDLIGPSGLQRIRRKAVNKIGSGIRKETRSLARIVFGTSAAALSVQGRAATPGSTDRPISSRSRRKFRLKSCPRSIAR